MKCRPFVWIGYAVLLIALLGIAFLAGRAAARPSVASAQAQAGADLLAVPNAASFYCSVNNVAAFDTRVHLRCTTSPGGGIYYFAYASDPAHFSTANQILAVANTAFALGKPVWVYYNSDSSLNPPGCNAGDCRGLVGVSMVQ
jgi:hypothetical protein